MAIGTVPDIASIVFQPLSRPQAFRHAYPLEQRLEAMRQMLEALRQGQLLVAAGATLDESTTLQARYLYHHAKLYMADRRAVLVISAN